MDVQLFLNKKGANGPVLGVLVMSQIFILDLKTIFRFDILVRTIFWTVLILVTKQVTKISTRLKLIRLRYVRIFSDSPSIFWDFLIK